MTSSLTTADDQLVIVHDPRIARLVANNIANGIGPMPDTELTPRSWRAVGYEQVAVIMTQYYVEHPEPNGSNRTVSASAPRHYWRTDLERGFSNLMPPPDAIIGRGPAPGELLPGWAPETVWNWMPYRVGAGNRTRGEDRVGYSQGRSGLAAK